MTLTYISMFLGYAIIIIVTIFKFEAGFYLALVSSVFHGAASALGESTILGFLKGYPSKLVGAFGSGTGMAGLGGALILLSFKQIHYFEEHEGYVSLPKF